MSTPSIPGHPSDQARPRSTILRRVIDAARTPDTDLFTRTQWIRERSWIGYGVALAAPLAGFGLRLALAEALQGYPFLLFFPGILLAAFLGGRAPGLLATAISAVLACYFLIAPYRSFALIWPSGGIALFLFACVAVLMTLLIDAAIRTSIKLFLATRALRDLNAALEQKVAVRTSELTILAAQLREEIRTKESIETQVRQMQKMQAIGELTGGIAHDFNNMLSVVLGSLDMARRRIVQGRSSDIERFVENAADGAKRAATLTHRLLAFSRKQPLAPVVTSINVVVSSMADLLRRTLGENIDLECVLAGGLWHALIDPGQLESAILNLAVNARDAMPAGGRLTIETQNAYLDEAYAVQHAEVSAGQHVMIGVTDTGIGMPEEVAVRAFDPFFTTKPEGHGTGLGLSQVYGFVKQSLGHIKIYSEPGHGTSIKIYFPRHLGSLAAADLRNTPLADVEAAHDIPRGVQDEVILVVEDDEAVRAVHAAILRELNYRVIEAANGMHAKSILDAGERVSLLFTDVVMPGMSGFELAKAARSAIPDLKVLYTTGYTPNAIVHNRIVDHGVDLLPKPFAYDQLARKVRAMLDQA